jgi:hypothetical protein
MAFLDCEELKAWQPGRGLRRHGQLTAIRKEHAAGETRQEALDELARKLEESGNQADLSAPGYLARKELETAYPGTRLAEDQAVGLIEQDRHGLYVGFWMYGARSRDETYRVVAMFAATFVKRMLFGYYLFREYTGPETVEELLAEMKVNVHNFVLENEPDEGLAP